MSSQSRVSEDPRPLQASDRLATSPSKSPATEAPPIELRKVPTKRSRRTRSAIIEAIRSLQAEGELQPTAARVAEYAGVSRRTIWQQFSDLETLSVEASRRDFEIVREFAQPIAVDQPLSDRTAQIIDQRIRMFEHMAPGWRAGRIREPFSPALQLNKARTLALARAQTKQVFAPELGRLRPRARKSLLDTLHGLTLWAFWDSLRTEVTLDPHQARQVLTNVVTSALADALRTTGEAEGRTRGANGQQPDLGDPDLGDTVTRA